MTLNNQRAELSSHHYSWPRTSPSHMETEIDLDLLPPTIHQIPLQTQQQCLIQLSVHHCKHHSCQESISEPWSFGVCLEDAIFSFLSWSFSFQIWGNCMFEFTVKIQIFQ